MIKVLSILCVGALFIWISVEGKDDVPVAEQLSNLFAPKNISNVR